MAAGWADSTDTPRRRPRRLGLPVWQHFRFPWPRGRRRATSDASEWVRAARSRTTVGFRRAPSHKQSAYHIKIVTLAGERVEPRRSLDPRYGSRIPENVRLIPRGATSRRSFGLSASAKWCSLFANYPARIDRVPRPQRTEETMIQTRAIRHPFHTAGASQVSDLPSRPITRRSAAVGSSGGGAFEAISRQIGTALEHCLARPDPKPGERILDLATGTGRTSRLVVRRGVDVGVDIASDLLAVATGREEGRPQH